MRVDSKQGPLLVAFGGKSVGFGVNQADPTRQRRTGVFGRGSASGGVAPPNLVGRRERLGGANAKAPSL